MLKYFFDKINYIFLLFILNIICMFKDQFFAVYVCTFIYFLYLSFRLFKIKFKKAVINTVIAKYVIVLSITMFITTLINLRNSIQVSQFLFMITAMINSAIAIEIAIIYGKKYIEKGLVYINRIMMIINLYGVIEFITRENKFIDLIVNESKRTMHLWSFHSDKYRVFTVFLHPIVYANILVIVFWINHFLCKNKIFKNLNCALIVFNLYGTKSRSAWISFILTAFVYLFYEVFKLLKEKKIKRKTVSIFFISLLIGVVMYKPIVLPVLDDVIGRFYQLNSSYGSVSSEQRIGAIRYILSQIYNSDILGLVFGHGFKSAHEVMNKTTISISGFLVIDNQYITTLWEFGLVGITSTILIILTAIRNIINSNKDRFLKLVVLIASSIYFNMFFYEIDGWNLMYNFYFFIIGSLCINYTYLED